MTNRKEHDYAVDVEWTGNRGHGTREYGAYGRDHMIVIAGKPEILGSSDPCFRGDATRINPEELFVSSLSACHMLWYLHLCADAGVVVCAYRDKAIGTMVEEPDGRGRFVQVLLRPQVTIDTGDVTLARRLHEVAHNHCFIANSVSCQVLCEAQIRKGAVGDNVTDRAAHSARDIGKKR